MPCTACRGQPNVGKHHGAGTIRNERPKSANMRAHQKDVRPTERPLPSTPKRTRDFVSKARAAVLERLRAKRRRGGFEVFTDRRDRFSGRIRRRVTETTPRKDTWQPFNVPDYLKSP